MWKIIKNFNLSPKRPCLAWKHLFWAINNVHTTYSATCTGEQGHKNIDRNKDRKNYTARVSEKNCANFFLSELRQISTNFGNCWHKDSKEAKIMRGALT